MLLVVRRASGASGAREERTNGALLIVASALPQVALTLQQRPVQAQNLVMPTSALAVSVLRLEVLLVVVLNDCFGVQVDASLPVAV